MICGVCMEIKLLLLLFRGEIQHTQGCWAFVFSAIFKPEQPSKKKWIENKMITVTKNLEKPIQWISDFIMYHRFRLSIWNKKVALTGK